MSLLISASDAIAGLAAIIARLNTNGGHPLLEVYNGARPATLTEPIGARVKLVVLSLDNVAAFQAPVDVGGQPYVQSTANTIADTPALATSVATWFRVVDDAGVAHWIGDVTEANLGGDLEISSVNMVQDVNVVTVALRVRFPKSE
jgi:hypothetical protein